MIVAGENLVDLQDSIIEDTGRSSRENIRTPLKGKFQCL